MADSPSLILVDVSLNVHLTGTFNAPTKNHTVRLARNARLAPIAQDLLNISHDERLRQLNRNRTRLPNETQRLPPVCQPIGVSCYAVFQFYLGNWLSGSLVDTVPVSSRRKTMVGTDTVVVGLSVVRAGRTSYDSSCCDETARGLYQIVTAGEKAAQKLCSGPFGSTSKKKTGWNEPHLVV